METMTGARQSGAQPAPWTDAVDWQADCILERDWPGGAPDEQETQAMLLLARAGLLDGVPAVPPSHGPQLRVAA